MVLIPKGKGDYRGIGLVEVMWKVVAVILNRRLTSSITFHDVLHGFRAGRGTGTANLEAKLLKQLDLEGGGPRAATCPEPMEYVVEGDGGGEAAI